MMQVHASNHYADGVTNSASKSATVTTSSDNFARDMGRSGTLDKTAYPAFVMSAEAAPESPQEWDPQSDPDWQSDEEVAYHEAGHAVVAYALGGRIMSMTVEDVEYPEGIERGLTRHYITGLDREIYRFKSRATAQPPLSQTLRIPTRNGRTY